MKPEEARETSATESPSESASIPAIASAPRVEPSSAVPTSCPNCGMSHDPNGGLTSSYVYAIGRIEARFPRPSVEKEFAQVTGRAETAGLTDRQVLQKVLTQRQNRYLVRELCWVLTIEGLETYILIPRESADLDLLIEALRPSPTILDLDVVIGTRGAIAPPQLCNGLMVPMVVFDQIYSFERAAFIDAIPLPPGADRKDFAAVAEEVFDRIMQLADNAGGTDGHRALNYLAVRYPAIYASAAEAFGRNAALTAVDVAPSRLSGARKVVDVIISYTNRNTDVTEKFYTRVDVTDKLPFLVTKLSPYYDR